MKRYHDSLVQQAKLLRTNNKLSFGQIGIKLDIPPNTIRNWCAGMDINKYDTLIASNERKRQEYMQSEIRAVPNLGKTLPDQSKFLAALLYGCEGSKYPASKGVSFSNSDPYLVATFLKLLRKSFTLDESKLHIHLQVHTTQNYAEIRKFWSALLEIPSSQFITPTLREPRGGKHRPIYMGTCSVRYGDYRIQLKLQGIFEEFIERMKAIRVL